MATSTRSRQVAVGIITKTIKVDDFSYSIFSNIVYPTQISLQVYSNVDGSELLNISGIGDISGATGSSIQISGALFSAFSLPYIPNISGAAYPTA